MHGVNLDLLRASAAHHPDGRPKDAHAHHRAAHRAAQAEEQAAQSQAALSRIIRRLGGWAFPARKTPTTCP